MVERRMLIDLKSLRDRAGNDDELVREVLHDFLSSVNAMMLAVEGSDGPRGAHRLRGALLALGCSDAAEAAHAVEAQSTETSVRELRGEIDRLLVEIRRILPTLGET